MEWAERLKIIKTIKEIKEQSCTCIPCFASTEDYLDGIELIVGGNYQIFDSEKTVLLNILEYLAPKCTPDKHSILNFENWIQGALIAQISTNILRRVFDQAGHSYHVKLMEEYSTRQHWENIVPMMQTSHSRNNINHLNTDPKKWFSDPLEVMKCFCDGNINSKSFDDLSMDDMLGIMLNNSSLLDGLGFNKDKLTKVYVHCRL